MAEWYEEAPVVESGPKQSEPDKADWWKDAPVVEKQDSSAHDEIRATPSGTDVAKAALRVAGGDISGIPVVTNAVLSHLTATKPGEGTKKLYDETVVAYHPEIKPGDENVRLPNPLTGLPDMSLRQAKNAVGALGDVVHGFVDPMNMALMVESAGVSTLPKVGGTLSRIIGGLFSEQAGESAVKSEIRAAGLPAGSSEREAAHFQTAADVAMSAAAGAGAAHPTAIKSLTETLFPKEEVPATAPITAPATEAAITTPMRPVEVPQISGSDPIEQAPMAEVLKPDETVTTPAGTERPTGEVLGARNEPAPSAAEPSAVSEPVRSAVDEKAAVAPTAEAPVSPEQTAVQGQATVPDLKSTEEAVAHGESGTADVPALNAKREELLAKAETATGDEKVALITQAQLYREAAETAEKTSSPGAVEDSTANAASTEAARATTSEPVSIAKEKVNERRAAEGNLPILDENPQKNTETYAKAEQKIAEDRNYGSDILDKLRSGEKTSVDPVEQAALIHEALTIRNERDAAAEKASDPKLSESDREQAHQKWVQSEDRLNQLDQATKLAGQSAARVMQFRQRELANDYTLPGIERKARAEKGGPLTAEETAKYKAIADELAALKAKMSETDNAKAQERQMAVYRQLVKESLTSTKETAKRGGTLQAALDSAAAKARQRIIDRRGRLQVTVDPLNVAGLVDEAIIGASHIARGLTKFADWSAQMVKDFGERISPYLKELFDRARQYHDAHAKLFEKSGAQSREEALSKITSNAAAGKELDQKMVYDLARAHVNAGVEGLDNVMKQVTADIQKAHPGITEREVRDRFSGYGETRLPSKAADLAALRDYRRQAQLVSALEDAQKGEAPLKSGQQRDKPSDKVRELQRQVAEAMKEHGIETSSPEEQLASTNQSRATSLRNQIKDLERRLATGERPVKGPPVPETPEVTALKAQRDALKEELRQVEEPSPKTPLTNEQKLARLKSVLKSKTEELQKKIAAGDYTKPTRSETKIDEEALDAQAKYNKVRQQFEAGLEKDRLAKRGWIEKTSSFIKSLARASILSHTSVLEHLGGAAIENVVTRPISSATAQLMRLNRTLDAIRKKAVYEGGWGGEMKGAKGLLTSGKATLQKLLTGKSDLDWLHNAKQYPKEFGEIVGHVHAAIKEPIRQGIYARALELGLKAAEEKGLNPAADRVLRAAISKDAYDMANMDIFMGDNFLTKALHNNVTAFLRGEKSNPRLAKFTADILDTLFPVVNVPVNIAIRKFRLLSGIPEAAIRLGIAKGEGKLANHAAKLSPKEAEQITRAFKYGLVGAALTVYAWKNPEQFGGIQVAGQNAPKEKGTDLKPGDIALPGGLHITHHAAHGPFGGHLNMVADARRLYDSQTAKHPDDPWSNVGETAFFMLFSAAKDLPMMSTLGRLTSPFYSAGQKAGELMKNIFVPGIVQDYAKYRDTENRQPATFTQEIESAIPGLREQVPAKQDKPVARERFSIRRRQR